jgi:hypothetical protein
MMKKSTRSSSFGLIASMIFAVSPLGLDTVGWTTLAVLHMDIVGICWSIFFMYEWIQKNKHQYITYSIIITLITVILDPFRTSSLVFILLALVGFTKREKMVSIIVNNKKVFLGIGFFSIIIFLWQIPRIEETVVYKIINKY